MPSTSPITHTVRMTRFYHGPHREVGYACRGTLAQCKQWVKDCKADIYQLDHNEYASPRYRIVRLDSLGPRAREQAGYAQTVDWHLAARHY